MTQDAQKFTDGDLKKAREITSQVSSVVLSGNTRNKLNHLFAQALRDERNGLEDQVLHLNEFNVEAVERIKGLEDRVRLAEAEIKSRIEQHDFQLEARENMIAFNNDRLKALEAENENAKFSFDALVKKYEAILYENSKMMLTYNDECKKYEAAVARLKEEVERLKLAVNSWMSSSARWCEKNDVSEARLAESVRVLMIAKEELEDRRMGTDDEGEDYNDEPVIALYNEITAFLSSPTNSEAQDRQRAKELEDSEERFDAAVNLLRSHKECQGNPCVFCHFLSSIPSEARGGCEHDDRKIWQGETYFLNKSDYPTCPFCDKKTGGV